MPTSKQPQHHIQVTGGANYGIRPHLIPEGAWRQAHNVYCTTSITQVPRKCVWHSIGPGWVDEFVQEIHVVKALDDVGHLLVYTTDGLYRITYKASDAFDTRQLYVAYQLSEIRESIFYRRWSVTQHGGKLYAVNEANPVFGTDGTQCDYLDAPAGRYIDTWFEHLLLGCPVVSGTTLESRISWSHLYDFTKWAAASTNEADHYDFWDWVGPVTGIGTFGDLRAIYTTDAIIVMEYVGLPKIVRIQSVNTGIGSSFRYGLIKVGNFHYFLDQKRRMAYASSLEGVKPIGEEIVQYVVDNLTTDVALQQRTWGYFDPVRWELVWLFCSTASTGAIDKAVAYNLKYKTWTTRDVEDVHGFHAHELDIARAFSDYSTEKCEQFTSSASLLGRSKLIPSLLYGSRCGQLLREADDSVAANLLLPQGVPVLETGDKHYGQLQGQKEVDSMTVHASLGNSAKLDVYHASRNLVDDAVSWSAASEWTATLPEGRLSFPRAAGTLLRYKFSPRTIGNPTDSVLTTLTQNGVTNKVLRSELWSHRYNTGYPPLSILQLDGTTRTEPGGATYMYKSCQLAYYEKATNVFKNVYAFWPDVAPPEYGAGTWGHAPGNAFDYPYENFFFFGHLPAGGVIHEFIRTKHCKYLEERIVQVPAPGKPDYWTRIKSVLHITGTFRRLVGIYFVYGQNGTMNMLFKAELETTYNPYEWESGGSSIVDTLGTYWIPNLVFTYYPS